MNAAPATVLRLLMLALLLCGIVLKPSLAIAEEMHDLLAHASVAADGHSHDAAPVADSGDAAPGKGTHDDGHFHLTHCCGQQAAVLPRLQLGVALAGTDSPVPRFVVDFTPASRAAPFRPPIQS